MDGVGIQLRGSTPGGGAGIQVFGSAPAGMEGGAGPYDLMNLGLETGPCARKFHRKARVGAELAMA